MYRLEFISHGLPPTGNKILRMHFRAYARLRDAWEKTILVHAANSGKPKTPLTKAKITFTRFSSVEPDADNLRFSYKPLLDAMKRAGIILDDKPGVIGEPSCFWVKARAKEGSISVVVEGAE